MSEWKNKINVKTIKFLKKLIINLKSGKSVELQISTKRAYEELGISEADTERARKEFVIYKSATIKLIEYVIKEEINQAKKSRLPGRRPFIKLNQD
jgi:CYTH domain-containing protein